MNTFTAVSFGVGLLLVAGLHAQTPTADPVSRLDRDRAGNPALKGHVLVLENERTITGDIERDGDRYRIRRLTGETTVPAIGVLRLCASLDEALAFLRGRANLADPDERLRLADWCRQHGLRDQAIAEVDAARSLRPEDIRIRRLWTALVESKKRAETPTRPVTPEPTLPRVEVDAETLATFAVKIQPILMNACASCHSGERGGSFHLRHPIAPGLTDRRAIDQNLAAVASLVDSSQPGRSKLLLKAMTIHAPGMVAPPLRKSHAAAVRTLESWAGQLAANRPGNPTPSVASVADRGVDTPRLPATGALTNPARLLPGSTSPTQTRFGENRPTTTPKEKEPEDPLGPDEFNREFFPKGKPTGSPDR